MKTDKQKALDKIQKCLSLSKSTNPHEAAQALKQAYALMRKHDISESVAVDCGDLIVGNELAATKTNKIANWVNYLINVIQDIFSVVSTASHYCDYKYYGGRLKHKTTLVFHGERGDVAIAEYAFTFLLRLLKKNRSDYYDQLNPLKPNRTQLADQYAIGWCIGVNKALTALRRFNPDEHEKHRDKVKNYINTLNVKLKDAKITKLSAPNMAAQLAGFNDGQTVEINRGVAAPDQQLIEVNL